MENTFAQAVAKWQNFYILAGGAAATLTGLLFIAVSLHIDLFSDSVDSRVRELAEGTLLNFVSVLVISLVMTSADASPSGIGIPLLAVAIFQSFRSVETSIKRYREMRKHAPGRFQLRFLLWQVPFASSALLIYVSLTLLSGDISKLYWLVWGVIPILLVATNNAWNMLVRLAQYKQRLAAQKAQPANTP